MDSTSGSQASFWQASTNSIVLLLSSLELSNFSCHFLQRNELCANFCRKISCRGGNSLKLLYWNFGRIRKGSRTKGIQRRKDTLKSWVQFKGYSWRNFSWSFLSNFVLYIKFGQQIKYRGNNTLKLSFWEFGSKLKGFRRIRAQKMKP